MDAKAAAAARAIASFQQRSLLMEITRQQNEDLDRLAGELARAKKLEEQRSSEIEASARLKSEFLANFSHEIRTPLNGILGYCDLVLREEGQRLTPHGRRDLGVIKANARTLLALINDILDLSKIEAGRVEIVNEHVDMEALVEECGSTLRESLRGKQVELRTIVEPGAKDVFTDPLKLKQILLNLLSNAAKFTDNGEVGAHGFGAGALARHRRRGHGQRYCARSALAYLREVPAGRRLAEAGASAGTGLGLAIVREVSKLLNGTVTVTSTLGRGSAFTVTLSRAVDRAREHRPGIQRVELSTPDSARETTVLIISDDPMIHQLLRGQLEEDGFKVYSAVDGIEGLTSAASYGRRSSCSTSSPQARRMGRARATEGRGRPRGNPRDHALRRGAAGAARSRSVPASTWLKPIEPTRLVDVVRKAIEPSMGDVLIVDDDADTREIVSRNLRKAGFHDHRGVERRGGAPQGTRRQPGDGHPRPADAQCRRLRGPADASRRGQPRSHRGPHGEGPLRRGRRTFCAKAWRGFSARTVSRYRRW